MLAGSDPGLPTPATTGPRHDDGPAERPVLGRVRRVETDVDATIAALGQGAAERADRLVGQQVLVDVVSQPSSTPMFQAADVPNACHFPAVSRTSFAHRDDGKSTECDHP